MKPMFEKDLLARHRANHFSMESTNDGLPPG